METTTNNGNDATELMKRGKSQLEDMQERAADRLDRATTSLGGGVENMGGAIESAGKSAGSSIKRTGQYLQKADPATMKEDLVDTIRRHPGATFAVGVGLGVLLTRAMSSRRS